RSGVVSVAWPSLRTSIIGSLPIDGTGSRGLKLRHATRCEAFSLGCLLSWSCEITPVSHDQICPLISRAFLAFLANLAQGLPLDVQPLILAIAEAASFRRSTASV